MTWSPWGTQSRRRFQQRANDAFRRGVHEMNADIDAMIAEHAAMGRLQSGATIKAAIAIFEKRSSRALNQTLAEAAKLIEHRGWKWRAAMSGIGEALETHIGAAVTILGRPFNLANAPGSPSVWSAAEERLAGVARRLRDQAAEFEQGWTAPTPKPWKDRHALVYAIILLIVGALIGLAVPTAKAWLHISG